VADVRGYIEHLQALVDSLLGKSSEQTIHLGQLVQVRVSRLEYGYELLLYNVLKPTRRFVVQPSRISVNDSDTMTSEDRDALSWLISKLIEVHFEEHSLKDKFSPIDD
jgi:hypothetical protein